MFLEFVGFVLTSCILAVIIAYKFTSDIYPHALKKKLNRIALVNWANHEPEKIKSNPVYDPTCTQDLAIFASDEERKLENTVEELEYNEHDELLFYGVDDKGNAITAQITRSFDNKTDCLLYIFINGLKYSIHRRNVLSTANEFSCGNFKLELVEPMRTWRLWYNGILESDSEDGNQKLVHATLNFLWKALEKPSDSRKGINIDLLSNYLTQDGNFGGNLAELRRILPEGYSQFGSLHGIIKIDDIEMPPLYLYGSRIRTQRSSSSKSSERSNQLELELFGMCGTDGNAFKLEAMNGGWIDGMIYYPSYAVNPILNMSEESTCFSTNHSLPKLFDLNDKARAFRIEIWPSVVTHKFTNLEVTSLRLGMNGKEGRGFLIRRKFGESCPQNLLNPREAVISSSLQHLQVSLSGTDVVNFDSDLCLNVSLVGGKGASLAKLARIAVATATGDEDVKFRTARGFCLTTSLFSSTLDIHKMSNIFSAAMNEIEVEQACSEVMNLIKGSKSEERIQSTIEPFMKQQFGSHQATNKTEMRFAVRSSGTLEDASDLSCAGQNETFLGVMEENIAKKVLECWASLFTPQSVLYRLNHGQPAMSEMGVVIQEMVDAQAAGVVFSVDPRTGNPFEMIINANFGLGESVVSATCDPDNITILRPRQIPRESNNSNPPKLTIGKKVLGEKKLRVDLSPDGNSMEVLVGEEEARKYCINDVHILKLGEIVVQIEKTLRNFKPIDVEWAIHKDGTVYILQSRHITALDSWTDFEIIHEMDSALRTNFERNTTANTGEVMPGASSPLTISTMTRVLDSAIQRRLHKNYNESIVPYMIRSCSVARQRVLLNIINLMYKNNDKEIGPAQVALDLSVFGHRVITEELHRIGVERHGIKSGRERIAFLAGAVKEIWKSKREVLRMEEKYGNYTVDQNSIGDNSKSIFENLTQKIFDLFDICIVHCSMSESSGVTQMFAFLTLAQGRHVDAWDSDLYEDVSKILAVCTEVESADVPSAMDELAGVIVSDGEFLDEFIQSSQARALECLQNKNTLREALDKFFEKHGHRCISELDLSRKSWKTDPLPFIQLLQSIVRNKVKAAKDTWKSAAKRSKYVNDDELLDSLKTKLTGGSRRFLKFLLPYCRNAVQNRERTKSILVRTADQLKPIYTLLARVMKEEKLIPNEKLVPFMTHQEIGLIISGHQSTHRILFKAMRRLKLHPELNKEQFPEISVGMIEPINQDIHLELGDSIQATPLSSGKVQATVKVCMNVEEASKLIEPGDILVTIGTDIGWSPFFPLLGGIVTELGGLISHGAVVAREYGLPCIVGATNATKIFKTGEQVVLDAGKGTLTKVKL